MRRCIWLVSMMVVPALTLGQSAPAPDAPKSPAVATLLSFLVAGGGQMYSGRSDKGAALLALSAGSVTIGALQSTTGGGWHARPLEAGLGIAAAAWLYGLATAWTDANRYNAQHGASSPAVAPSIREASNGRALIGISLAFGR